MNISLMKKRWIILAAMIVQYFCTGAPYMWSIFNNPLVEANNWDLGQVSLAYSALMLFVFISNVITGQLQGKISVRKLMIAAGLFWSAGWFLTGFAKTLPQLYLFFSATVGIGGGIVYNTLVSLLPYWFPDRKGFTNGLLASASGIAPVFLAPLGYFFLDNFGVLNSFKYLGIIFFVLMLGTVWIITSPKAGWLPDGWGAVKVAKTSAVKDKTSREMLKTPQFYMIWFVVMACCTAGSIMTGHASNIGQELVNITASQGALMVSFLAIMSFLGRLSMGYLSDKIGRQKTILIIASAISLDMILFFFVSNFMMFAVAVGIVGFSFGAFMAVFPVLVGDVFGQKHFSSNFPLVYSGYTCAFFVGLLATAKFLEVSGSYQNVFIMSAVLAIISVVLISLVIKMDKKDKQINKK